MSMTIAKVAEGVFQGALVSRHRIWGKKGGSLRNGEKYGKTNNQTARWAPTKVRNGVSLQKSNIDTKNCRFLSANFSGYLC